MAGQRHAVPGAARLPRQARRPAAAPARAPARRSRSRSAGTSSPSRGWLRWSRLVDRHRWVAAVVGVAALLALAAPFLDVRFGFPDAGNNVEADPDPAGLRPARRGLRPRHERAAAAGRRAAQPATRRAARAAGRRAAVDRRRRRGHRAGRQPGRRHRGHHRRPTDGPQAPATEDLVHRAARHHAPGRRSPGTGARRARRRRHRHLDRQHRQHRQADPAAHRRRGAAVDAAAAAVVPHRSRSRSRPP